LLLEIQQDLRHDRADFVEGMAMGSGDGDLEPAPGQRVVAGAHPRRELLVEH